jgi:dTDP-4-dehydrorhamnose reductase
MKVLILGDGKLGSEIKNQTGWDLVSRKLNTFDIDSNKSEWTQIFSDYDVILNCIANTNTYSDDKSEMVKINYEFVVNLTDFCLKHNKKLVHISTDFVYANSDENISETDIPVHHKSWYAYSKLLADAYIELKLKDYLICRLSHKPYPFPYENAWTDVFSNADYTDKISDLVVNLIKNNAVGIFNVGTTLKSIYDLAILTSNVNPIICENTKVPKKISMEFGKLENFFIYL